MFNTNKELKELAKSVIVAVISAFLIINFIFETVSVDGLSMFSTLHNKDRLIVEKISYYFRDPKKDDIVVFKYPQNNDEKFIKRVIAVAGEKIKIENDKVYVNGKLKVEPYSYYDKVIPLNDDRIHNIEETIVPVDTIFVMGDNRYNSFDSRFSDVGFVNKKLVVGRATLRLYPFNYIGKVR